MLQIENRHFVLVQKILSKHPYQFYAYGSRAKEKASKTSDLDICYYEDIPNSVFSDIEEEFTESDLPFEVELVAWKNMRPAIQKLIKKDLILISALS